MAQQRMSAEAFRRWVRGQVRSPGRRRRNKYGARPVWVGNRRFDSRKEARRYEELRLLECAGEIRDLQCQVAFELLPAEGKERPVVYVADFVYRAKDGTLVVEDTKGYRTREYRLKKRLLWALHGIRIRET